jgi:uncharacterized protein YtpQ (UPF0354 family)
MKQTRQQSNWQHLLDQCNLPLKLRWEVSDFVDHLISNQITKSHDDIIREEVEERCDDATDEMLDELKEAMNIMFTKTLTSKRDKTLIPILNAATVKLIEKYK